MAEAVWHIEKFKDTKQEVMNKILACIDFTVALSTDYLIVNVIGDSWGACYPADKLVQVVEYYIEKDITIVFTGAGDMAWEYYASVLDGICDNKDKIINLCNSTSVEEVMSLMVKAKAFLGTDSGLAHVAYYLDIPSVVLMADNVYTRIIYMHECGNMVYLTGKCDCGGCENCRYLRSGKEIKCVGSIDARKIICEIDRLMLS